MSIAFDLFRFQILPRDRIQWNLYDGIKSLDQLLSKKNELFASALVKVKQFRTRKSPIKHRQLFKDKDSFLFRFAANRSLKRETEEFTEEEISNWPAFYVFIWNDPNQQIIAVQERSSAFQKTNVVAQSILDAVDIELGFSNLRLHYEALFLEKEFWDLVAEHKGKIRDIKFEIITPNMSNIAESLSDELKSFAKATNTARTNFDIEADPDSSIIVDPNDKQMRGLVQYSSEGCGNISLKIKGISRRIHTNETKKRIDIDEFELNGLDGASISEILKNLIK